MNSPNIGENNSSFWNIIRTQFCVFGRFMGNRHGRNWTNSKNLLKHTKSIPWVSIPRVSIPRVSIPRVSLQYNLLQLIKLREKLSWKCSADVQVWLNCWFRTHHSKFRFRHSIAAAFILRTRDRPIPLFWNRYRYFQKNCNRYLTSCRYSIGHWYW